MTCLAASAAEPQVRTFIRGIVRDSTNTQGLPYASVTLSPSGKRVVCDGKGIFEINAPGNTTEFVVSCQGYASRTIPFRRNSFGLYDISLEPEAQELKEVVVKKRRYSKRNNPAVDFARRLRNSRELTDPRRNDYYSYDTYERITMGLNKFDTTANGQILKHMPFLIEHVDSSEIDGVPVLNFSLNEIAASQYWKKDGSVDRTVVRGTRQTGIDEFLEQGNIQAYLTDLLAENDLYQGDLQFMRNSFVSPLAAVAPDFYRFYLVDSAAHVDGYDDKHIALAFYPRNKSTFGFSGHVYVPLGDTTMFIRRVEMKTPKDVNLNFIKDMMIAQTFERGPDGSRLKRTDDLYMILNIFPGTPEFYVTRKISLSNHSFEQPDSADTIFGTIGRETVLKGSDNRDTTFWRAQHAEALTNTNEDRITLLVDRLRRKKGYYWTEKILRIIFDGYVGTKPKGSLFDLGPVNTFASYNDLEGLRLKVGGMTTTNLSKRWFGRAYVAYGFHDRKWKYEGEVEYSFNDKKKHSREFPVHSIRLTHRYDVDRLGAHYLNNNGDNFLMSLTRMADNRFSYCRRTLLEYTLELPNHFSVYASAEHNRQEASPHVPFITGTGEVLGHFVETTLGLRLRWAPGEKFYQTRSRRKVIDPMKPIFELSHNVAPKGFLGTRYSINRTELSVQKQFNMSFMGRFEAKLTGAHIWGTAPFTDLLIPNANLSYIIQPEGFALLNPMEFINSTTVSLIAKWELRGAFFNLFPGIRKLGLREIITYKGFWGHLNSKNRPGNSPYLLQFPDMAGTVRMDNTPYSEISVGIDNILRLFRIDYVWRLSYLNVPYQIDRHGLRATIHITF